MAVSLSSIATGTRLKAPKITMYGVGGIGKTTFAAGAQNPIFLFTEEGQGSLDVARFELRDNDPVLRTWQELLDCVGALYTEDHDHRTVVVDTLDFAEPLLWRHTCEKWHQDSIDAPTKEFGYSRGFGYAVDEARVLLQGLEALRNDKGMAVVLLCHAQVKQFKSPDLEAYDRYRFRLQDRLADLVHDWSDAVLFANYRAHVVKDTEGAGKGRKERARGVGLGERIVYTEARPAHVAKNRYGLPPEITLSWQAFQDGIVQPAAKPEPKPKTTTKAG